MTGHVQRQANTLFPHWKLLIFNRTPRMGRMKYEMGYFYGLIFIAYSIKVTSR